MSHKGGYSHSAFIYALKECDYRLIDTAVRYNNEDEIGLVVKESGVPREELFLTTKLWPAQYGYESTIIDFQKSCKRLGVDYIDLYLMHWPDCPNACKDKRQLRADTWRAMETLYKQDHYFEVER
ncbi:PREDICTED: uncharacterized oxidoreductase ZK1290.5-like [Priapulus caudatus]|uniref:Uncharacterized oxidoreductase ZK1290.5-like n=1 Tax=Priapulus caudatus TaxID=37621 RepID=A0ABM1EK14_PRICU|nr:PREDICTED: uncharacterized oxidoreductase ZK1290.5-like [Priapulus caudatus]